MAVPYYGDFPVNHTSVVIPFNAFTSNDPSASATVTDFAATDVHIHKNGSLTQRASAAGVAIDIDVDAITGGHWVTIDLSDNTDAGFYAAGSEISVRIEGVTIDGATVNAFIGSFSIERAGGALALLKAGTVKVDVETIKTRAITCGAAVTVRADVGAAAAPGAANGMLIGGSNEATTFVSMSVTGQLDAGNVLVDTTTALTGAVTAPAGVTANLTGNITGTLGTVTNLTNLPAAGALETTLTAMKGATFDTATDSLEALRNRGDAAWITATSVTVSDKTGFSLANTGADLILKTSTFTQAVVDAINEEIAEGTITHAQLQRILLSFISGIATGGGTTTITFKDLANTKARITMTVDTDGNRSAVTLDGA